MLKKTYSNRLLLLLHLILFHFYIANAVPAKPGPINYTQPDGSVVVLHLYGDEFYNYKTTTDGYLVVEDANGYINYAKADKNGKISSLNMRSNNENNRSKQELEFVSRLTKPTNFTQFSEEKKSKLESVSKRSTSSVAPRKAFPLSGNPRSLVILVNFSDKNFVISNSQQSFTNLLNQPGYLANGGTGSAKDYFRDNSSGAFDPIFDVVGPYTLSNNMAYYGQNSSGDDIRSRQMIIDACTKADEAGVDFTQYDTDNDGYVDNIFVYYAGYNEAEGGNSNTIWPHRWVLANTSTKFDGKIIYDYACTSELKGTSGSNMCGIGTFVHEFGHVLELPDFYATNNGTHHTLSYWDVMDAGPYNNSGRTPPAYSAYERFFLGWLTPTELKTPQNVSLDTLTTSNQAYLISKNGNHNLNGASPSPVEFFMFENRQKKGWDAFLPSHGLLVTRVYYSSSTWYSNTVNNTSTSMGVDIIEADDVASDATNSGDTYPGTSNNIIYNPTLRSGTSIGKPLSDIKETAGIITFKFMGGESFAETAPIATVATNVSQVSFTANWNTVTYADKYLLDVFEVNGIDTTYIADFKLKNVGNVTSIKIDGLDQQKTYYYRLKAVGGEVATIYSNTITVTTSAYTFTSFKPTAVEASEITANSFKANWMWNSTLFTPQSYKITVFTKVKGTNIENLTLGFDENTIPSGWSANISYFTTEGYYGTGAPSAYLTTDGAYIQTPLFDKKITSLSFWHRGRNTASANALLIYTSKNGTDWDLLKTIQPIATTTGAEISIPESEFPDCSALKIVHLKPSIGNIAIDDIKIGLQSIDNLPLASYDNIGVGSINEHTIEGLSENNEYYYYVSAFNNGETTENSNTIKVLTLATALENIYTTNNYKISRLANGFDLKSLINTSNNKVELYNTNGQKVFQARFDHTIYIPMNSRGIYIIKINNSTAKVVW